MSTTRGGSSEPHTAREPSPTARVAETLAAAARLAASMGHSYLGTEHLLMALLDDPQGIAGQILNRGRRGSSLRQELELVMADPLYSTPSHRLHEH